jgi:carboxyl-terminal processing protease
MKRRAFLFATLGAAWSARAAVPRGNAADFDTLWQSIDSGYAYFEAASRARWRAVRERLRGPAGRAPTPAAFVAVVDGALGELRDDHVTLAGAPARLARRIPYELDIWPRWNAGAVTIEAVRTFGDADVAGLHAGQSITRIQGVPIEAAVREMLGGKPGSVADMEWALRRLMAGPRQGIQTLEVRERGNLARVEVDRAATKPPTTPAVLARRIGTQRDLAYIRVRIGDRAPDVASQFDAALRQLTATRALLLDLRESVGPGDRALTLAILSRFARSASAWQAHGLPGKPRVTDVVQPGADPYASPVVVLVDRWTAGEGEALAAGLEAVSRARIVGTPMAGLRGELREVELPASGLTVRFPGERAYTVDGRPREALPPSVPVDLAAPSGGPGDPILYQALKLFDRG